MALPTFTTAPRAADRPLAPAEAAIRLGVNRRAVDKLIAAGILPIPLDAGAVENLARRPRLAVTEGELTVLRTDARKPATDSDSRRWIGFHLEHDDATLAETSLRWWRSDPDRVLDNVLYAVTIGTVPVAVYQIQIHLDSIEVAGYQRHHYAGTLLTRIGPREPVNRTSEEGPPHTLDSRDGDPFVVTTSLRNPNQHELMGHALQIMRSRITVESGGPIGYLEPDR